MAKDKLRKFGKLSVALLEGFLEKKLGSQFVDVLRKGHQEHEALIEAIANTEERFRAEYPDKAVTKAIFDDLSLEELPSLREACHAFYLRPSSSELPIALRGLFKSDFGDDSFETINQVIATYLTIFREELAQLDENFRENSRALSDFSREELLHEILSVLQGIDSALEVNLARLSDSSRSLSGPSSEYANVQIVLEGVSAGEFAETQDALITTVAALLQTQKDNVRVLYVKQGSIKVDLQIPYEKLQQFKNLILQNSSELRELGVVSLKPEWERNMLNMLPHPQPDFVGRERELKYALDQIKSAKENIIKIFDVAGIGGIGKTSLALQIAHSLKADFPDGQIFLNLKGPDHYPLSSREILSFVIRAFNPSFLLPEDLDTLKDIYKYTLAGQRVLLVFDDVSSPEQVQDLIPPIGSFLLLTSRRSLGALGGVSLVLGSLSIEESVELLLKFAPRVGNLAQELAELCGYHPLALQIAAKTLQSNEDLEPMEYISNLREGLSQATPVDRTLGESVGEVIGKSYQRLGKRLRRHFDRLSVFPHSFSSTAVASIWATDKGTAENELDALASFGLIEPEESGNRYSLHNLVRAFASSKVTPSERVRAEEMHSQHYFSLLKNSNLLFLLGNESTLTGLAAFDIDRANIEVGQKWAANNLASIEKATRLANDYPTAGLNILDLRLFPIELIEWLEVAIIAAEELNDKKSIAYHLGRLGSTYSILGQTGKAIEYLERSLQISQELGDPLGEGNATGSLASAYASLGEIRKAIDLHERALEISRRIGNRRSEGSELGNLGLAFAALGQARKAIEFYEDALKISREIGDLRGEGNATGNLGNAYANLGETRKAIELHEKALEISREIGDRLSEAQDLGNLGNAYSAFGEPRKAIEYYKQALEISRESGDRRSEASVLGNLGLAYAGIGDTRTAIEHHTQALEISREIGARRSESQDLGNLGNAYATLGEPRKAIDLHEKALAISREVGDRRSEGQDLGNLGNAYATLGEIRKAIGYYEQALEISREVGDLLGESNAIGNLGNAFASLGDTRKAIELLETALEINHEIGVRRNEGNAPWAKTRGLGKID